jgi:hypothetical protein
MKNRKPLKRSGINGFLVEHTRLELVTPTLPVLCAPKLR